MEDQPSDRVNQLLSRYQQGSPGSKKRERVASPTSDSASAKKPLRDDGSGTGKFEPNAEPVRGLSYKHDAEKAAISFAPDVRPSTTLDDADVPKKKTQPAFGVTQSDLQKDVDDGAAVETSPAPRPTSPTARNPSPQPPDPTAAASPPSSPMERSISPPASKPLLPDNPVSFEELSVSPERSVSPSGEKTSMFAKERPVSPLQQETRVKDNDNGKLVTKRSAAYDELEDSLADLDALADGIGTEGAAQEETAQVKERSRSTSSLDAADLDFSIIESSSQLDVAASKERVMLRQKGSLAKRRKPTRSSMRSRGNDEDMFAVEIPVDDEPDDLMNGNDNKAKEIVEEKEEKETKKMPNRTSFMLPGLGEQPKLRKSKPMVPLPTKSSPLTATTPVTTTEPSPVVESTPAWMVEARLKRQSRQPAETPSIKREPDSDKPAWMREAIAKKRRSLDMLNKKDLMTKDKEDEADHSTTEAPWLKDRPLKHIPRMTAMEQTTDETNNNTGTGAPNVHNVGGATIFSTGPSTKIDMQSSLDKEEKSSKSKTEKEILSEKDLKNGNNKLLSESSFSRDRLTPTKPTPPVDTNSNPTTTSDENIPPSVESETRTSTVISPLEQTGNTSILRNKAQLPPISSNNNEQGDENVPSWKAEIQQRRRSKLFIPSQKPDQPIKLVETPKWKLDLAERTKNKRDTDTPKPMTDILTQPTTPQPHTAPSSVPPWQQELAERKKRNSLNPRVLEPLDKPSAKEEPEWASLAEKRRSRIANSGLVKA